LICSCTSIDRRIQFSCPVMDSMSRSIPSKSSRRWVRTSRVYSRLPLSSIRVRMCRFASIEAPSPLRSMLSHSVSTVLSARV
jgi:hypothetical protein